MTKPTDHIGTSTKHKLSNLQLILLCLANAPAGTDKKQVSDLIKGLKQLAQEEPKGREGALEALDRLYEENSEALNQLAQEDN